MIDFINVIRFNDFTETVQCFPCMNCRPAKPSNDTSGHKEIMQLYCSIVVFLYLAFVLSIVGLWPAGWGIIIFLLMSQGSPLAGFILTFLFLVKNLKKDMQNNNLKLTV